MTQVIAISKEGYNAVTETNPNNLTFSSEYNTLKYYSSGTIDVTFASASAGTAEGTVTHGLGYVPFFVGMVNKFASGVDTTVFNMCPGTFSDVGVYAYANVYAGTGDLRFQVQRTAGTTTYTFRYFIFRNNIGL